MSEPPPESPLERLRWLIERELGLVFEDSRLTVLLEVLGRRVSETRLDEASYVEHLAQSRPREELSLLARELTVGETYLFRHAQQFEALRALLIAGRERWTRSGPRILSAGCATGEEPYSLAMLWKETLPEHEPAIQAVDINRASLERAREGRFSAWSLRETPEALAKRWFRQAGQAFILDPAILKAVTFREANLAADDAATFQASSYDIIFCRNVLMYFGTEKCRQAVARLCEALVPGGYLFLGSAETLRGVSHDFHLCHELGAFFYQRKESRGAVPAVAAVTPASSMPLGTESRVLTAARHNVDEADWVGSIARAAEKVRLLAAGDSGEVSRAARAREERTWEAAHGRSAVESWRRSALSVPLELLHKEQFSAALAHLRDLPAHMRADPEVQLLEAVLLASGDKLEEAELVCQRLLASDELNAGAHYVLALCGAGSGRVEEALYHDRVAAYLDPHFAMPRLHLGLTLRRAGQRALAHAELRTARSLLEHEDAGRLLLFGGGFGRAALLELCRAELAATEASN